MQISEEDELIIYDVYKKKYCSPIATFRALRYIYGYGQRPTRKQITRIGRKYLALEEKRKNGSADCKAAEAPAQLEDNGNDVDCTETTETNVPHNRPPEGKIKIVNDNLVPAIHQNAIEDQEDDIAITAFLASIASRTDAVESAVPAAAPAVAAGSNGMAAKQSTDKPKRRANKATQGEMEKLRQRIRELEADLADAQSENESLRQQLTALSVVPITSYTIISN